MRRLILTILICCFHVIQVLAQDPAPTSPTAVSPNYTWYKKILQGDTSIFAYSNGMWANIARREWVKKAIKDSLSKGKFVSYAGAKANLDLGDKALLAGSIVTATLGASASMDEKSLNLSSPSLGSTVYSIPSIKNTTNGFTKALMFGGSTENRTLSLPDKTGVLAVDEETVHKYGDEAINGVKSFQSKPIVPGITRSDGAQPIWNYGTQNLSGLTFNSLTPDPILTLNSTNLGHVALQVNGRIYVSAAIESNGAVLNDRIEFRDRIQVTNDKFYMDNFNGGFGIASSVNGGRAIGISADGKVYIGSQASSTSPINSIMFAGKKIRNISTNKDVLFQGDTISNLEATSIKNQATLSSGFLKTDANGLLINGGYTPANVANVISKTGYADQVFDGNLGAGDGYIQTTNSGSGRIGRLHGSMFSDIGTINNLNLATNGGFDATLSAINNINLVTGANYSVRANSFTVTGNTGPGIRLNAQSTTHITPGMGQQDLYADGLGRFTIMGSEGFAASLSTTALAGNQVYSLPNSSGTLALKENPVSTFSNDAGYLTTTTGDSRYPQLSSTYTNPSWLGSLAYNKIALVPANTILANNTGAAGAATAITFYESGEQPYSGNITWTATTAPSGTTTNTYQWSQIGKTVTLKITLVYSVAGNSVQDLYVDLPPDLPVPAVPAGFAPTDNVNAGYGGFATATVNPITQATRIGFTRRNGVWKLRSVGGATNAMVAHLNVIYFTN